MPPVFACVSLWFVRWWLWRRYRTCVVWRLREMSSTIKVWMHLLMWLAVNVLVCDTFQLLQWREICTFFLILVLTYFLLVMCFWASRGEFSAIVAIIGVKEREFVEALNYVSLPEACSASIPIENFLQRRISLGKLEAQCRCCLWCRIGMLSMEFESVVQWLCTLWQWRPHHMQHDWIMCVIAMKVFTPTIVMYMQVNPLGGGRGTCPLCSMPRMCLPFKCGCVSSCLVWCSSCTPWRVATLARAEQSCRWSHQAYGHQESLGQGQQPHGLFSCCVVAY